MAILLFHTLIFARETRHFGVVAVRERRLLTDVDVGIRYELLISAPLIRPEDKSAPGTPTTDCSESCSCQVCQFWSLRPVPDWSVWIR